MCSLSHKRLCYLAAQGLINPLSLQRWDKEIERSDMRVLGQGKRSTQTNRSFILVPSPGRHDASRGLVHLQFRSSGQQLWPFSFFCISPQPLHVEKALNSNRFLITGSVINSCTTEVQGVSQVTVVIVWPLSVVMFPHWEGDKLISCFKSAERQS